jgi:nucleoside-diphosphate-sugar epimerase
MTDNPAIVTGVPGWLGTRFVQCLQQGLPEVDLLAAGSGRRISVLSNDAISNQEVSSFANRGNAAIRIVRGNLLQRDSLPPLFEDAAGATLFHLAGVIHPTGGTREFHDVNWTGTENLLRIAATSGIKRFIYMSSNSPMGTNPEKEAQFDESSPYKPYMNYGHSKMLAEQSVKRAGASTALETVIIRSPWFYGPGQPARQNLFFTMIKTGKVPLVGDGSNKRSMAYIDNICQGLLLAEKSALANGQTYWIADRRPYAMTEIIDTIEGLLENEFHIQVAHKRMHLPNAASDIAFALDWLWQSVGIYHQKVHVLSEMNKTIACSVAKAESELAYDPKVALKEGMRRSIKWVLDQGATI